MVGKLKTHKYTIDACLRLHNFIVNYREERRGSADGSLGAATRNNPLFRDRFDEDEELNRASDVFIRLHPFHSFGTRVDNHSSEELAPRGRRSNDLRALRDKGIEFRDEICYELHRRGMVRPVVGRSVRRDRHYRPVVD